MNICCFSTSGTPHRHAPAARTRYHLGAMGQARRVAKSSSVATTHGSEVKGEIRNKHFSLAEKRRDAKSGRAKPQAASRVSAGELGRRQADGLPCQSAAPCRGVSISVRVSRAAPTVRCSRFGTARHDAARCAGTTYLSCTHHTRCML